jgi:hypothetical protein
MCLEDYVIFISESLLCSTCPAYAVGPQKVFVELNYVGEVIYTANLFILLYDSSFMKSIRTGRN